MFKELKIWFVVIVGLISCNEGYATVPLTTDLFYTVANLNTVVMKEIWKPVVGYEGFYDVSNLGSVRRVKRSLLHKGRHVAYVKPMIMKLSVDTYGYKTVELSVNRKRKRTAVHRLVALAFIPNPKGKTQVNHKDLDKTNNVVTNLEWTTPKENCNHAWENGACTATWKGKFGKNHFNHSKIDQYTTDDVYVASFYGFHEAAREMGLYAQNIHKACNGVYKTCGGYKWKYAKDKI